MKLQKYEEKNLVIQKVFEKLKKEQPGRFQRRIDISYSSPTFGIESVEQSIERLAGFGYKYIEIPGDYGGATVGNHTKVGGILDALDRYNMKCSGICPFTLEHFSLTSLVESNKQAARDYLIANVKLCKDLGGTYYLVTPGTVRAPRPIDENDWDRSVKLMRELAPTFMENHVTCAIEPVSAYATAICHDISQAKRYIADVNHPGVQHIYGDIGHMLNGEEHVGQAILDAGDMLLNLHLRDTCNGNPIGNGMADVDTVIRALYLIGFNTEGHYVVGEPGVSKMGMAHDKKTLDFYAGETIRTFRKREEELLAAT